MAAEAQNLDDLVASLAAESLRDVRNPYSPGNEGNELRARRLTEYLRDKRSASLILVGEAPGYLGAAISGIPFTSERQITGSGPAESTATIVHAALRDFGIASEVLLWNLFPLHPHRPGQPSSNRAPTAVEIGTV